MNIAVVGAGYVGLVTAGCLADLGHTVSCVDVDPHRISVLEAGTVPIFEPGLQGVVDRARAAGRLAFTMDLAAAIDGCEACFIAVGTPAGSDGSVDLTQVRAVVSEIAAHAAAPITLVVKSTVPVGTTALVREWLAEEPASVAIEVAANPEFLRQGSAVEDFMNPDRIVIGTDTPVAEEALRHVYQPLLNSGVPVVFTNTASAELVKYASNAFLAIKLSFINEMADLCEASGASIGDVARAIGLDPRIGPSYLHPGPGFGGSCLPKDIQGLLHSSERHGARSQIVAAALGVNVARRQKMVERIAKAAGGLEGKRVALLGLTYKGGTDDLRESPAIDIALGMVRAGAKVRAYDPEGMGAAKGVLPPTVEFAGDAYDAMLGADVLVIATEWKEFALLDLDEVKARMATPVIMDLRNLYEPSDLAEAGIVYESIGRP